MLKNGVKRMDRHSFNSHDFAGLPPKHADNTETAPKDRYCQFAPARQVSLCETLDRVLNKGVVLVGEITISIADIDLIYIGLNLIVSSAETLISNFVKSGSN